MKHTQTRAEILRLEGFPFIEELILCGINSLIEVMELPVGKLVQATTPSIASKLLELSGDKEVWLNPEDQLVQLQYIINKLCGDKPTIEKVMNLSEQKFDLILRERLL